ncbi:hypothetical protein TI39_contig4494g00001 [Zymoseptoria brevis]|uniref:Cell wall protein n=1 Tax=Zymoseptoria brevis TaxID=1047168 RepID=A0A0F4G6I0_9PEZI|nr:hypothetical protein TI39_contig4494g00001 [Zymoseptoria brevis]
MKVAAILPFAVASLAAVSRRQNPGDNLAGDLAAITAATNTLADTVANFDGDAVPLATDTQGVFDAIAVAQADADATTAYDAGQLANALAPTQDLNAAVKTAIDNTIAQKDALVNACLGPVVYQSLLDQQTASGLLVETIASKAPNDLFAGLVRSNSEPAATDLARGVAAFADAQGCAASTTTTTDAATTTTTGDVTTTTGDAETTTTGDAETTTTGEATSTTTGEEAPVYPTNAPVYPTDGAPYSQEHPSTYPVSSTEYETSYVTYCPLTSTKAVDNKPVPTTYYGWSTVTVTIYPTEHPAPTYPASSTEYVTYYETYAPVTTTVIVDNKPVPTTIAVYTTVTVTVAPVKTACPSPAVYTHPAAPAAPAAPAETKPANAIQQIGDGQIQTPAKPGEASPIQQINDGQIQNPAKPADASPIQQINDGQIQNPASPGAAAPAKPAAYPAKPTNGTGYAKSTSPATPEIYTGAASKASIVSFGAFFVAAVGVAAF